jgi:hypothetical protein
MRSDDFFTHDRFALIFLFFSAMYSLIPSSLVDILASYIPILLQKIDQTITAYYCRVRAPTRLELMA